MKFCANISTLFRDIPKLTDRYVHLCRLQSAVNVKAVECQNPYLHPIDEWKAVIDDCTAKTNKTPNWILINSIPLFDVCKHIPSIDEYKERVLQKTLDYAIALNVRKVHLLLQDISDNNEMPKMFELLQFASKFMASHNITCVIEPLSIRPNYYLRSYAVAKDIVCRLNEPNLKVMLDTFHMQKLHGNLTENIDMITDIVGHVQISQTPDRDSPMKPGEVDHDYVLKYISKFYDDFIGLEYNGGLKDFGRQLPVAMGVDIPIINPFADYSRCIDVLSASKGDGIKSGVGSGGDDGGTVTSGSIGGYDGSQGASGAGAIADGGSAFNRLRPSLIGTR